MSYFDISFCLLSFALPIDFCILLISSNFTQISIIKNLNFIVYKQKTFINKSDIKLYSQTLLADTPKLLSCLLAHTF